MTAIAIQHREQIIAGLQAGRYLKDIAAELGVSTPAICQYLAQDPEYVAAREIGAGLKIEHREVLVEDARDALSLARARELLSHARWRAEREFPHRWGQRTHVTVDLTIELGDRLRRARERTIPAQSDAIPLITE